MMSFLQMRAMRVAMQEKLATRAVGHSGNLEEMTKARWIQTAKDLPVVALGSGLGYASGRFLGEQASKHLLKGSPGAQKVLSYALPITTSMLSATGAYALGRQRALLRQRRDEADMLKKFNKSVKQASPASTTSTRRNYPRFVRDEARENRVKNLKRLASPDEDDDGRLPLGEDDT